ncbi:proline dehydrogenase family protein [Niallia sp. Krafla_26]|uniref:proline dehydrogenase family protein n=1 Tax=Niallia sp. Krafla_26 TaxID=3064703 RepID=UPI003D16B212
MIEKISRNFFLHVSKNILLNKAAKRWGLRLGASQVVAGDCIEQMVSKVKELNKDGFVCTLDNLGEFVMSKEEAVAATEQIIQTLEAISKNKLNSQLSVKLTQLGIDIDRKFCVQNMYRILNTAKKYQIFVTIDMEDYSHCELTLDVLAELRKTYNNVGTVIQAYLFRSVQDVKNLKGIPLRLVKGAYKESNNVAYQDKRLIDENLLELIKIHLLSKSYTAIATHDHQLIDRVKKIVEENEISPDQFEFQMLYGFRNELQQQLLSEGYRVRVYVPFGTDWFAYYMRRLAERPQNITFALRGFFSK